MQFVDGQEMILSKMIIINSDNGSAMCRILTLIIFTGIASQPALHMLLKFDTMSIISAALVG